MSREKIIRNTAKAYRMLLDGEDMIKLDIWKEADVTYIFEEFLKMGKLINGSVGRLYVHLDIEPAEQDKVDAYFRNKGKPDPNAEMAAFCKSRANFYRRYM